MKSKYQGMCLEVAGEIVGYVALEDKKTLLIREAYLFGHDLILGEKAMFVKKDKLINQYWLRFKKPSAVSKTVNSVASNGFIRELLNI